MPPLAANDGLQGGELRFEGFDTLQELLASFWCLCFVRCPPAKRPGAAMIKARLVMLFDPGS